MSSPSSRRPPRRQSKLAGEHPAYPLPVEQPTPTASPAPESEPAAQPSATTDVPGSPPMPPPRRRREVRVQLNTRIRQQLHDRLQRFVDEHEAAVQDVVETALGEYLDRRAGR